MFSEKNLIYKIKIIHIFNHLNTDCPTSLRNTVIEKIQAWKTVNVKKDAWLGNLCKAVKTKQKPRCFLNDSEYFKTKLPRIYISKVVSKILRKKKTTQLTDHLPAFVIFLCRKSKIFIANHFV